MLSSLGMFRVPHLYECGGFSVFYFYGDVWKYLFRAERGLAGYPMEIIQLSATATHETADFRHRSQSDLRRLA